MRIDISYNNITPDNPLEVFINEKIGTLEKIIPDENANAKVEVGKPSNHHRKGDIFYAEVNIHLGGNLFRAEANNKDLRTAILTVKDELHMQLVKFKEKRLDSERQPHG